MKGVILPIRKPDLCFSGYDSEVKLVTDEYKITVENFPKNNRVIYVAKAVATDRYDRMFFVIIHYNKKEDRYHFELLNDKNGYLPTYEVCNIFFLKGNGFVFSTEQVKGLKLCVSPRPIVYGPKLSIPYKASTGNFPILLHDEVRIPQKIIYEDKLPENLLRTMSFNRKVRDTVFTDPM